MDRGAWRAAVHGVAKSWTERLHFHFSLSCIGEGNGTPLQCSCLENPRDGEAWWAAVYGVTQSRTRLKRLSSSNSATLPRNLTMSLFCCFYKRQKLKKKLKIGKGPKLTFFQRMYVFQKMHKSPMCMWKDVQHHQALEKCKLKPQRNITSHLLEWLALKG